MACFTLNTGITNDCLGSMGGIKYVWLADYSGRNESDFDGDDEGYCLDSIVKENWHKFEVRKGSSNMTSTMNIDDANGTNYITTELQLVFARMSSQKRYVLNSLRAGEMMAIVVDNNGNGWFLGYDNPITITAGTAQTGTAIGDANNYQVTITDTSIDLPFPVGQNVISELTA